MSYRICPSCGASDGQGCYSTCPTMLQARVTELERQIEEYDFLHHEGGAESVAALEARVTELEKEVQWHKDASARRGAAEAVVLRRLKELEETLQWIDQQRYTDRRTITFDDAFDIAVSLNDQLVAIMDKARAALNPTTQETRDE